MADTAAADIVVVDIVAAVGTAAVDIRLAGIAAAVPSADRVVSIPLAGTAADLPWDTAAQGMMDMGSDPQTGKADTGWMMDTAVHKVDIVWMTDTARIALQSKQASSCRPSRRRQLLQ